eukprot:TRINITY_DN3239_c0_g1_i1.p1 TRINITY_DN3239_c0_g1~~TRINITY_DN3239_c0_g1_i1.p1  ORF type:complete len:478 (-),score=56.95 TRINITY_DN3239_c0_g1_i1:351-1724(-)
MTDVAYSYLAASYVLETLANSFEASKYSTSRATTGGADFNYNISVKNFYPEELHPLIIEFLCILNDNEHIGEEEKFSYYESRNEFECNLYDIKLNFPEIIDLYFANQVNGADNEAEVEHFSKFSISNPERKYGYWIGASYLNQENKVLYSQSCWIASNNIALADLFIEDSSNQSVSIIPANLLVINSQGMVVSENGVIQISMGEVIQGIACIHDFFPNKDNYSYHHLDSFDGSFFSTANHFNTSESSSFWQNDAEFELYVSEFGEFVIFKTDEASLVLFDINKPTYSKSQSFINAMLTIGASFEDEVLSGPHLKLNWDLLDDELFEQLCYDIIYQNSKYDNTTIRKMGSSRSRDGGRDIVVYSKELHNNKPKRFIFQCKLIKSSRSLNTSNIGSISDVIDQYGAKGYGVMCNSVIDAALFDRLDGISENRGIEIETWSSLEIERFIARRPNLKSRYF